jgi:hypothetical protein
MVIAICLLLLVALGAAERVAADRARRAVPIRIHVNGTRGKSTVTRLVASALREAGVPTVAKVTGTAPRLLLPDGTERPVVRRGSANIREQNWLLRRAARLRARAVVAECMAVRPDLQFISEHRMVQATIGVVTNVRLDHTEVMGRNTREIARSLANSTPREGVLVYGGDAFVEVFRERCRVMGARLVLSTERADYLSADHSSAEHADHTEPVSADHADHSSAEHADYTEPVSADHAGHPSAEHADYTEPVSVDHAGHSSAEHADYTEPVSVDHADHSSAEHADYTEPVSTDRTEASDPLSAEHARHGHMPPSAFSLSPDCLPADAENFRTALAVTRELGIDDEVAWRGFRKAAPDPGAAREFWLAVGTTALRCLDATAANDPESLDLLASADRPPGNCVCVYNHRSDRPERLRLFAQKSATVRSADVLLITGERPSAWLMHELQRALATTAGKRNRYSLAGSVRFVSAARVLDVLRAMPEANRLGRVVFCGNTRGMDTRMLPGFRNQDSGMR